MFSLLTLFELFEAGLYLYGQSYLRPKFLFQKDSTLIINNSWFIESTADDPKFSWRLPGDRKFIWSTVSRLGVSAMRTSFFFFQHHPLF